MHPSSFLPLVTLALAGLLMAGCGLFSKKSPYDLAKEGNIQMLKLFLEEGGDVNGEYGGNGRSLLFGAVEQDNPKVAKFLIEFGADVNFKDSLDNTPLIHAVSQGNRKPVELLLEKGAKVNAVNSSGQSAVYRAVSRRKPELVKLLLDHGADVNFRDDGVTLLHRAVQHGDLKSVRVLLDHRVKVNVKNEEGFTPLFYAEEFSYREISRLLKKHGARLKHTAPTERYYRKVYNKRLGKGPLRVKRVIKHAGTSEMEVYSPDGTWLAQVVQVKSDNQGDSPPYVVPDMVKSILERNDRNGSYVLRVWDVKKGKEKFPAIYLPNSPYSMEIAPDGKLLLTHTQNGGIEVRDPATGKRIRTIGNEEGGVLGIGRVGSRQFLVAGENKHAFANAHENLLNGFYPAFREMTGGLEHSVWVYDYETGTMVHEYPGHMGVVEQAGFSFDGRYVASISTRGFDSTGPLKIWETATGRPIPVQRNLGWVYDILPFPKDRRLAALNHSRTLILDMENGQVVRHIREGGNHAGLLQEGRYIALLKYGEFVLVSTLTGRVVQEANFEEELHRLGTGYGNTEYLTSLKASPTGDSFFIATSHGKLIFLELKHS